MPRTLTASPPASPPVQAALLHQPQRSAGPARADGLPHPPGASASTGGGAAKLPPRGAAPSGQLPEIADLGWGAEPAAEECVRRAALAELAHVRVMTTATLWVPCPSISGRRGARGVRGPRRVVRRDGAEGGRLRRQKAGRARII